MSNTIQNVEGQPNQNPSNALPSNSAADSQITLTARIGLEVLQASSVVSAETSIQPGASSSDETCFGCMDPLSLVDRVVKLHTNSIHQACVTCFNRLLERRRHCPICRATIDLDVDGNPYEYPPIENNPVEEQFDDLPDLINTLNEAPTLASRKQALKALLKEAIRSRRFDVVNGLLDYNAQQQPEAQIPEYYVNRARVAVAEASSPRIPIEDLFESAISSNDLSEVTNAIDNTQPLILKKHYLEMTVYGVAQINRLDLLNVLLAYNDRQEPGVKISERHLTYARGIATGETPDDIDYTSSGDDSSDDD